MPTEAPLEDTQDNASSPRGSGRFRKPASELDKLARALRFTGSQVEGPLARPIARTAEGIETAAQRLRDTNPDELVRVIEDFARRRPFAFLGAAVLVGFGGSRFFKSSATTRSTTGADSASS